MQDIVESDLLIFARISESESGSTVISARVFNFEEAEFIGEIKQVEYKDETQLNELIRFMLFGAGADLFIDAGEREDVEVFVDGKSYGFAPVTITTLSAGTHNVLLRSATGEEQKEEIKLGTEEPVQVNVELGGVPEVRGTSFTKMLPGIGLMVVGAAGLGFGIMQSREIQALNKDLSTIEGKYPDIFREDKTVNKAPASRPQGETDSIILEWKDTQNRSADSQAGVLQYVGYGVGALGLISGGYLLYHAMGAEGFTTESDIDLSFNPSPTEPEASLRIRF